MSVPRLVYGTAWKKGQTSDLVYTALKSGFRGIDTACQPKHYEEKLVGDGIRSAISSGLVKREDLFIQTKFTSPSGQDPQRTPYDFSLSTTEQVRKSINTSLENLHTGDITYLDSVLLHSPLPTLHETLLAWKTLSTYVSTGQIHRLGISNCSAQILLTLLESEEIAIKPSFVQNRFYAATKHDVEVREICREFGIVWQSFWTLTGNPEIMRRRDGAVERLARRVGVSRVTAMYSFVLGLNEGCMTVLCGTTDELHMLEDLAGDERVRAWARGEGRREWEELQRLFEEEIGG